MTNHQRSVVAWRKSSASGLAECVEAGVEADVILVRNSKVPDGAVLHMPVAVWEDFLQATKDGELDEP